MENSWRELVNFHGNNAEFTARVAENLDVIWQIPEGRELITAAAAQSSSGSIEMLTGLTVQDLPDWYQQAFYQGEPADAPIYAEARKDYNLRFPDAPLPFDDMTVITTSEMLTLLPDGTARPTQLMETIIHELYHVADPNVSYAESLPKAEALVNAVATHRVQSETLTGEQRLEINRVLDDLGGRLEGLADAMNVEQSGQWSSRVDEMLAMAPDHAMDALKGFIAVETGISPEVYALQPLSTQNLEDIERAVGLRDPQEGMFDRAEEQAVRYTNEFTSKYFALSPRAGYLGVRFPEEVIGPPQSVGVMAPPAFDCSVSPTLLYSPDIVDMPDGTSVSPPTIHADVSCEEVTRLR